MISKLKYRLIFVLLGIIALMVNHLFGYYPDIVERFYFGTIFQGLRIAYDFTLGWLPFPILYLALPASIFVLGRIFSQSLNATHKKPWWIKIGFVLLDILAFAGGIIFLFYIVWGYNYKRPSIYDQLHISQSKVDSSYLISEVDRVTAELIALRQEISTDTISIIEQDLPADMESHLRDLQTSLLSDWDKPHNGRVRIRVLKPKGILLRLSSAGVYIPIVFEGHIDAGLHPIQWPFTMAHEMAHGYGYGDEGTCNFIGYLTCMKSDYPLIRYSASRAYWRYLMNDLRKVNPEKYKSIRRHLPATVIKDLNEIYNNIMQYPDLFPAARDVIYDQYLKSHGISSGLQNYGHMVRYMKAYREAGE